MNPIPPQSFFKWFDQVLREKGWSDRQVTSLAGISHSVLSKARNNVQGIGWDAGVALAKALDVPIMVMFERLGLMPEFPRKQSTALEEELSALYAHLTDEDKDEILQLVRMKAERRKQRVGKKAG